MLGNYQFDSADQNALYIHNIDVQVQAFTTLFRNIRFFLWVIGSCMLFSGIVGINNMMLVAVKERTQELGIRKIFGASAQETLIMILSESILLSLTVGVVGMLVGMMAIYGLNNLLDYMGPTLHLTMAHLVFRLPAAIAALLLLVISGAVAGIVPAKRAMAILPIKALNTE